MTEFDLIWTDEEKQEGEKEAYNKALDDFAKTILPRLTDAIYPKDVQSMTNLINDVVEELKRGGEE